MFATRRFLQMFEQLRARVAIPLRLELWDGRCLDFSGNPTVKIAIPEPSALRYFLPPDLDKLGEAFVEGHIRVEGPINEVFRVGESLARSLAGGAREAPRAPVRHSRRGDRRAIEYHYDVSDDLYALFLDRNMVYSCAYYRRQSDDLETAQLQKLDHVLTKLRLKPGERFLDVGCGWGALVIRAASKYGAVATGITLSKNQYEFARERIRTAGLQDRCTVELRDYRALPDSGAFDKIASVGMFEHVGLKNLRGYFSAMRSALKDDGLMLNHGITSSDPDCGWMGMGAGRFIDRYVFPDGELPHLSLALREMALAGLEVMDVESLRRHYARTCREWSGNLEAARERACAIVGDRRYRIWQIYLAGCAHGFASGWINIYQVLACNAERMPVEALPLTREYMYAPD